MWGLEDTQRFNICAKLQDKKAGLDYFECVTQPTAEATRRPFTSQCDTTELESRKSRKGEFAVCNSRCMLKCVLGVVLPSCHHVSLELCQNSFHIPLFLVFLRAPSTPLVSTVFCWWSMKHEFGIGAGQVLKVSLSSGARQLLCSWRSFCWLIVLPWMCNGCCNGFTLQSMSTWYMWTWSHPRPSGTLWPGAF